MIEFIKANYNYLVVVVILALGLWAMIAKNNLVKKSIGMAIFQTGIILFYISMGAKKGSTIPILPHGAGDHAVNAAYYANPLTHILMLTAIVVGVATLGLAFTLIQNIYADYGSLEEDEVLEKLSQ